MLTSQKGSHITMSIHKIVYADPPWSYSDKANSGNRGASHKYPTMSIDDIKSLPVGDLVVENGLLFIWVTMPLIQEGLDTIKAWGFNYKTCAFVWVKTNRKSGGNFMGMGNWTRSNAELCLLGVKGSNKRQNASVRQIIEAPEPDTIYSPMTRHSAKPPEVRDRIVQLCGDIARVELFARDKTDFWDCWGNEVTGCEYVHGILKSG